jgi:hypothetical protein
MVQVSCPRKGAPKIKIPGDTKYQRLHRSRQKYLFSTRCPILSKQSRLRIESVEFSQLVFEAWRPLSSRGFDFEEIDEALDVFASATCRPVSLACKRSRLIIKVVSSRERESERLNMANGFHGTRGQRQAPDGENSPTNTVARLVSVPSLKRSRSLASCESEHSAISDRFSWRNNGPVRRVRRNVKWAFQLESFPAPDFVKRRPVFGSSMVKGILKRPTNASRVSKEEAGVPNTKETASKLQSPGSALDEASTNSDVSSQFEDDGCDGEEHDQQPRRTKFKLMLSPV